MAILALASFAFTALGCGSSAPSEDGVIDERLRIVTTTGMIGDAATRIAGDAARVEALMGPGVDPHLFKASEGDVRRLAEADLIVYNGLHLEGKMGDILGRLGRTRSTLAVGETLPESALRAPPEFAGQFDPHLWFDVRRWSQILTPLAKRMGELAPEHADLFRANAEALAAEYEDLDRWVEEQTATIPEANRTLVTAHDAFGYFGDRYGIEVMPLQGISTLSEAGLGDVDRVVDAVVEGQIPAIFIESSVPRRAIEAVLAACRSRGHEAALGGELFSDAMGAAGTPEGTYPGMVRHNVETIVRALGGQVEALRSGPADEGIEALSDEPADKAAEGQIE